MARCSFCGKPYEKVRYDQVSCSSRCNINFKNLEMSRAKRIYRVLYWWRLGRQKRFHGVVSMADNLRFLAREIREWIEEDRKLGRPPPPMHDHSADRGHQRGTLVVVPPEVRLGVYDAGIVEDVV